MKLLAIGLDAESFSYSFETCLQADILDVEAK